MHPLAELIYGEDGRDVHTPASEDDLHSYVECGLLDLSMYLARKEGSDA